MPGNGGKRAGAGRPRGTRNQRHSGGLLEAMGPGVLPLDYMVSILRDEAADPKDRGWAAEKAAPFLYAKPAPLARTIHLDLPDTTTANGMRAALAALTQAAASGQISPAEAQSMAALIEGQRKVLETEDLLRRLEALEAANPR